MPVYELSVLLKILPRPDAAAALKRVGTLLLNKGVVMKKLENLGTKDLPYKIPKDDVKHEKGSYFAFTFVGNHSIFADITQECRLDVDIIRFGFANVPKDISTCTLEEELLPPAYRPSVQKLLETSKQHKWKTVPFNKYYREYEYFNIHM